MMRRILIAIIVFLAVVICLMNIAFADNSARIMELKREEQEIWNKIASYKEIALMSEDDFRRHIRGLENGIVGTQARVKELQAQDIEAREIERLEAERIVAEEKAKKEAKEEAKVAPKAEEPEEEVAPVEKSEILN